MFFMNPNMPEQKVASNAMFKSLPAHLFQFSKPGNIPASCYEHVGVRASPQPTVFLKNHRVFNAEDAHFLVFSLRPLRLCDLCVYNTPFVSTTAT